MRHLAATLAFLALLPAGAVRADPLDTLKGRARPVVVLSDARDDPKAAKQISALDGAGPELAERNMQVLREAERNGPLRRKLGVAREGFAVVLVGKDGGVKKVWRDPVDPKAIFTIIDSMPMRREEMKG